MKERRRFIATSAVVGVCLAAALTATGALGQLTVGSPEPQPEISVESAPPAPTLSVDQGPPPSGAPLPGSVPTGPSLQGSDVAVQPAPPPAPAPPAPAPAPVPPAPTSQEVLQPAVSPEADQEAVSGETFQPATPVPPPNTPPPATPPGIAVEPSPPTPPISVEPSASTPPISVETPPASPSVAVPVSPSRPEAPGVGGHVADAAGGASDGAKQDATRQSEKLRSGDSFAERSQGGQHLRYSGQWAQTLRPVGGVTNRASPLLDLADQKDRGRSTSRALGHVAATSWAGYVGAAAGLTCAPGGPLAIACAAGGSALFGWLGGTVYDAGADAKPKPKRERCENREPDGPCRDTQRVFFVPLMRL